MNLVDRAFEWSMGGSIWRSFGVLAAATAAIVAVIFLILWLTGSLDQPTCQPGKTLILVPVGKVMIPQCM